MCSDGIEGIKAEFRGKEEGMVCKRLGSEGFPVTIKEVSRFSHPLTPFPGITPSVASGGHSSLCELPAGSIKHELCRRPLLRVIFFSILLYVLDVAGLFQETVQPARKFLRQIQTDRQTNVHTETHKHRQTNMHSHT